MIEKILKWAGLLSQLVAVYLLITGLNSSESDNTNILISVTLIIGLAYPFIRFKESDSEDLSLEIVSALFGLIAIVIAGFVFKESSSGFFEGLIDALISQGFLITYIILLVFADIASAHGNPLFVGLAFGALSPLVLAGIIYAILFVIAIALMLIFGSSNSNGSSSGYDSINTRSSESGNSQVGGNVSQGSESGPSYYCIWTDGSTMISKMPNDLTFNCDHSPSYGEVEQYLKKKLGKFTVHVLLVKPSGSSDSVLNYLDQLKALYGNRPL